jgi:hypothetical protein
MAMRNLALFASVVVSVGVLACGSSIQTGTGGGGAGAGGAGAGGAGAGGGGPAGCSPTDPCPQGSFCDYADDQCGKGAPTGTCAVSPVSDCGQAPLACGCDGVIAMSCGGAVGLGASVDIGPPETCPAPAGYFLCGDVYCSLSSSQYCQGSLNLDTCGEDHGCAPIPTACLGTPTCGCLTMAEGLISCAGDATQGLTGLLPGGDSPSCP